MKTIYIHIGTEKTGTTYIQSTLKNNRDTLLKAGVLYPAIGISENPLAHSSLVAPLCLIENENASLDFVPHCDFTADEEWGKLRGIINDNPNKDVVISAEHFSSRLRGSGIDYIKDFFSTYFSDYKIRIVVYLRRQDQFMISAYSTHLKSGGKLQYSSFLEMALNRDYYFDYVSMLQNWEDRFGKENIIVKPFEKEQFKGDLIEDFLDIIGLGGVEVAPVSIQNETLSNLALHLGPVINKKLETQDKVKLRRFLNIVSRIEADGVQSPLSPEDRIILIYNYLPDNEYISDRYLNGVPVFINAKEKIRCGVLTKNECCNTDELIQGVFKFLDAKGLFS